MFDEIRSFVVDELIVQLDSISIYKSNEENFLFTASSSIGRSDWEMKTNCFDQQLTTSIERTFQTDKKW